jgi:hypothetical protein
MPGEDQRQTPATVPRLFDELFEAPQCLGMQVMPVVNEQSDRLLAAAHHFHEGPLAPHSTGFLRKCRFRLFSCGGAQALPAWTI